MVAVPPLAVPLLLVVAVCTCPDQVASTNLWARISPSLMFPRQGPMKRLIAVAFVVLVLWVLRTVLAPLADGLTMHMPCRTQHLPAREEVSSSAAQPLRRRESPSARRGPSGESSIASPS